MFNSARLKLTAWYLLIVMLISLSFSLVIYNRLVNEVDRFTRSQRLRLERRWLPGMPLPFPLIDQELVEETKHRLFLILLGINSGILIISGGLGYFLAGRTLKPIKEMLDEQKQFVSDSSHELRTPLTALKTSLEVNLRDKALTLKDVRKLLAGCLADVNHLQYLANGLLHLSQYEEPGNLTQFQLISLKTIITKAIAKVEPLAVKKKQTIKDLTVDSTIEGNPLGLTELVVILLDNAIKYSPANKTITISAKKTDGWINLLVEDQGIGISAKDLPHIFDRFFRADAARSKVNSCGYGLGLTIAQKIAKLHNGVISVKSKVNQGSLFTLSLPINQKQVLAWPSLFSEFSDSLSKLLKI